MASYRFLIQKLSGSFDGCEFLHVPCSENEAADTLAKIALSRQAILSGVSLEHLHKPSVRPSTDSESIYVPDNPAAPQPGPGTAESTRGLLSSTRPPSSRTQPSPTPTRGLPTRNPPWWSSSLW